MMHRWLFPVFHRGKRFGFQFRFHLFPTPIPLVKHNGNGHEFQDIMWLVGIAHYRLKLVVAA